MKISFKYMIIDIHSILSNNPITRNVLKPKFGYNFLGPYNPLDNQIDYDKRLGTIHKIRVKPMELTCFMMFAMLLVRIKMYVIEKW